MYDIIVGLVGTLPEEFEFIYSILALVLSTLLIAFLFQLFYVPINFLKR